MNSNILRTRYAGSRQDGDVWARGDKAQSNVEDGLRASKQRRRAQSPLKPSPQVETDLGQKRGVSLFGPLSLLGQEMGGKQPISMKGSLRRDDPSAKGKGKVGYEASEAQVRGSVLKCGSKKLWNALFPSSSGCRQGGQSRSEPLTLERPSSASDDLPKKDSFEAGTQLERSFSTSPSRFSGSRKKVFRGLGRNVAVVWRRGSKVYS